MRRFILWFFIILLIAAVIILVDSNIRLVTTEFQLYFEDIPESFDGYRIVLLADKHGTVHCENNSRLIEAIRDANPDIIAFAGDLIDRFQPGNPVEQQFVTAEHFVGELVHIAPVYFVTGNHEWDSGMVRPFLEMLTASGVNVLQNRYVLLNPPGQPDASETIILAGIEDPGGPADMIRPDEFLGRIYENHDNPFVVVMYHRNNLLPLVSEFGADLLLSGHAHGGMVRLPFTDGLVGPQYELFPTYTSCLYTEGDSKMIVSRGIGNHFGWTRFNNNPQVVVVELRAG